MAAESYRGTCARTEPNTLPGFSHGGEGLDPPAEGRRSHRELLLPTRCLGRAGVCGLLAAALPAPCEWFVSPRAVHGPLLTHANTTWLLRTNRVRGFDGATTCFQVVSGRRLPITPSRPTDGTGAAAKEHVDKLIKSRLCGSRRGEERSCVTVGFWRLLKMWEKIREENLISTPPCLRNGETRTETRPASHMKLEKLVHPLPVVQTLPRRCSINTHF